MHINNICQRNYVTVESGRRLRPTNLGIVLVHGYYKIGESGCLWLPGFCLGCDAAFVSAHPLKGPATGPQLPLQGCYTGPPEDVPLQELCVVDG